MSDSIESLRAKMRAEKDPRLKYGIAKQVIAALREAEADGHAAPAPIAKPIRPRQDPIAAYAAAKARIAQKGGTPSEPPPAQPARKHSQGAQTWPPAHLRQRVEAARSHSA
jgi:hypothetical protein